MEISPQSNNTSLVKEKNENTIFVGNLPNTIKLEEVKKLFRQFGKILNARLRCAIRKELKIPKKLSVIKKDFHKDSNHINAFIKFEDFESCKKALKMNGKIHEGHHLRVNLAGDETKSDSRRSIFVGNLPFKTQDDDLWQTFEDFGEIESVRLVRDGKTGIGKGFGYVNFKSADSVELALTLDGITVLDRNVRVSRIVSDSKYRKEIKKAKKVKNAHQKLKSESREKQSSTETEAKPLVKTKVKHEFQGKKTKPSLSKKLKKKKKKLDKRQIIIKQIAKNITEDVKKKS